MFQEGSLLYFTPLFFKNDAAPKPKYFLVVKNIGQQTLLVSLPSSQTHFPTNLPITYGCVSHQSFGIGFFAFEANTELTDTGFSFPLDTFLYGQHLDTYDTANIQNQYPFPDIDYKNIGILLPTFLTQIIECFKQSSVVKNKIKRLL